MKISRSFLALGLALILGGCFGEALLDKKEGTFPTTDDPYAACTDKDHCCENYVCTGDPDGVMTCGCADLWDCSKNPKKCEQPTPQPPGGGTWNCTWSEFSYTCTQDSPDGQGDTPPGGGSWSCIWNNHEAAWECSTGAVPNPTNSPEGVGVWTCVVQGDSLVCTRGDTPPPDLPIVEPDGPGGWNCTTNEFGKKECTLEGGDEGLPPGGDGSWSCHRIEKSGVPVWICQGESTTPPGGGGWNCEPVAEEFNTWRCEKPETSDDVPPGGGWWSCVKGTEFGGTQCEQVGEEPEPPGFHDDGECSVGEKMWCDGLEYCGWGQVECDPATGKWKTRKDGLLDCYELSDGRRPNTVCACYHFLFNGECCERPDCIVPAGSTGQLCPKSAGELCDFCNALNSECSEPGGRCIITDNNETFCGRECNASNPCPTGYDCHIGITAQGQVRQCVPQDGSCYY